MIKYPVLLVFGIIIGFEFNLEHVKKLVETVEPFIPEDYKSYLTYPTPGTEETVPWPGKTSIVVCRNGRSNESISFFPGADFGFLKTWAAQRLYPDSFWRDHKLYNTFGVEIENKTQLAESIVLSNRTKYVLVPNGHYFIWPSFTIGHEEEIQRDECRNRLGNYLKIKTASISPKSFTIDDFVNDEEVDYILESSKGKVIRSKVYAKNSTDQVSKARNSEQTWIHKKISSLVDNIADRIRICLSFVEEENTEPLQVVHYDPEQHYHAHHDYFDHTTLTEPSPNLKAGKNRFLTVLFYLNNVEEGGETNFPRADDWNESYDNNHTTCHHGLKVTPRKYSVIMFYSLTAEGHREGQYDPRSLHAGCDVTKGEKWVANKWIHNRGFPGTPGNVFS